MESSLKSKIFNFLKNQKMNVEETENRIKIILNQRLNVIIKVHEHIIIILEYLESNDFMFLARLNSEFFEYSIPNFFKWKVRDRVETPADVLVKICTCVNNFEDHINEEFMVNKDKKVNSWHINVNRDAFKDMTGNWPGQYFRDFFVQIFEKKKSSSLIGEKLFEVKCYFQRKNSEYKLICEENVDFYSRPLKSYIKYMYTQIFASRTNTKLLESSSFSDSSSIH